MVKQAFFFMNRKKWLYQIDIHLKYTDSLLMISMLILLLSLFATIGYILIQFDEIAGKVGLCKFRILESAQSKIYHNETEFNSALLLCDNTP